MNYVYIVASKYQGSLYIGVTNDIERRLYEHRSECIEGFTSRYHIHRLVYYEAYADIKDAIRREKQLKGWRRDKKISLFETSNPEWKDLSKNWE